MCLGTEIPNSRYRSVLWGEKTNTVFGVNTEKSRYHAVLSICPPKVITNPWKWRSSYWHFSSPWFRVGKYFPFYRGANVSTALLQSVDTLETKSARFLLISEHAVHRHRTNTGNKRRSCVGWGRHVIQASTHFFFRLNVRHGKIMEK